MRKSLYGNDGVICPDTILVLLINVYIYIYSNKAQAKLNDSRGTREYVDDDDAFVSTV